MHIKSILKYITAFMLCAACSNQPQHRSDKYETIEVYYVNWACDCANFIETKYYKADSNYRTKEEDCIFIERATPDLAIPEEYFNTLHFEKYVKLYGQYYKDEGTNYL